MSESSNPNPEDPKLSATLVDEVTQEVFGTMFGMQAEPVTEPQEVDDVTPSAYVGIGGSWQGMVWVRARRPLIIELVTLVQEIEPEEVDEESIMDTLAELANMIGGCFKARLGNGCRLSLPKVRLDEQSTPCPNTDEPLEYLVDGQLVQVYLDGPTRTCGTTDAAA